jgi:hypothetical protein
VAKNEKVIAIPKPDFQVFDVQVVGTTALICHRWSEKAKAEMLAKQQGKKLPKPPKDPEADYRASLYEFTNDDGVVWYGFPAVAFKNAAVRAAQQFDIPMTTARQLFWVYGVDDPDHVTIDGEPTMREDVVRLNGKTADLRYRGQFYPWSAILRVKVNAQVVAPETVFNLIAQAGFSVGVGEWRPERNGQFGCFEVR